MIYLLKTSQFNESFLLDSYATSLEGTKLIAENYAEDMDWQITKMELNETNNELEVEYDCFGEYTITFYIATIEQKID